MTNCDLQQANLSAADFSRANLLKSILREANLMATDFRGTVLEGVRGLTSQQLSQSVTSFQTVLPNGGNGPFVRGNSSEMPFFR
jgi:uncharacterized protein YjbI with pentapeptide repeats